MHIQTPLGKIEIQPTELKQIAGAFGLDKVDFTPVTRLLGIANKWADRFEPAKTEVEQVAEKAIGQNPQKPGETEAKGQKLPEKGFAIDSEGKIFAMPQEGDVLDHTKALVKVADIVKVIQQNAPDNPEPPKGDCQDCLLLHPLTKKPAKEICGECMNDMLRPKFVKKTF